MKVSSYLVLLLTLLLSSCRSKPAPIVAFYYWKTNFNLSLTEKQVLSDNHVSKLYIRYFDIVLDSKTKQAIPESPILFEQSVGKLIIVPVVYIKNEIFLQKEADILDLVKKSLHYIDQINKQSGIVNREIQVDCDWTMKSRDRYLKFVRLLKQESKKDISATIRLHQVKYAAQTKVPEVNYGVLMYYNMGKLAVDENNSIYNSKVAKKYLGQLNYYPLSLRVALPIFSWGIHIRNNKIINVIGKLRIQSFSNDTCFVKRGNWIETKTAKLKSGYYFKAGDEIKFEKVSEMELTEMAKDLGEKLKNPPAEVIFYDLDSLNIRMYEKDIFKKVTHSF